MDLILKGGCIITPSCTYVADVAVKDGKIAAIGKNLSCDEIVRNNPNVEIVDISGKMLLPGAVDPHTHLDLDLGFCVTADDYFTGTRAAACGGTTTIIDYPTQYNEETIVEACKKRYEIAKDKCCVDYGFHCAITDLSGGAIFDQFSEAIEAGITSFKCYMVYRDRGMMLNDADLVKVLKAAKDAGVMISVHAENEDLISSNCKDLVAKGNTSPWYHYVSRPEYVSGEAVSRIIGYTKQVDGQVYIVHTDSKQGIEAITKAQNEGYHIYAETCAQYLEFTNDVYKQKDGINFICSPPIKGEESRQSLWNAIKNNTISTIATDHCSFNSKDKAIGADDFTKVPNGLSSLEISYPYILSKANEGLISFNRAVELCASNPARIFGCSTKGEIAAGFDADLVVYDSKKEVVIKNKNLHSGADHVVWEDKVFKGYPIMTYSRGRLIYKNGEFLGESGWGKYIKRKKPNLY